jgi:hypothetical protein
MSNPIDLQQNGLPTISPFEEAQADCPAPAWKPGDPERRQPPVNRKVHSDRILAVLRKFPGLSKFLYQA